MVTCNKKMRKEKREQEGIMHVYFRANGRYTVFYDDEDNLQLLRKMYKYAQIYNTRILEYALMGNHAHFLIETSCVTLFMREALKSYSRWYNRKYKNSNKVFATPFSSACKRTEEWMLESSAYILQNPQKAGMVIHVEDYKWNSVLFHFPDDDKRTHIDPVLAKRIKEAIRVDTTLVDKFFNNFKEFLIFMNNNPVAFSKVIPEKSKWEICTLEKLSSEVNRLLDGKMLNNLSKEELVNLIVELKHSTNAPMLYIASVLHVDYKFVKQCFKL